jgi:hypothetical protein
MGQCVWELLDRQLSVERPMMTRNRNCPVNSLASAAVDEIVTGSGHVYPLSEYGLTIFHGHMAATELQKTTGIPDKTGDRDHRGGREGIYTKK